VVKQSFFGLPGQYGRRVTKANLGRTVDKLLNGSREVYFWKAKLKFVSTDATRLFKKAEGVISHLLQTDQNWTDLYFFPFKVKC